MTQLKGGGKCERKLIYNMQNRGKQFEEVIRKDFEKVKDTSVIRLPDPVQGYLGYRNICDFLVYHYPHQYCIECKSTKTNVLPFVNITKNQWQGLGEVAKIKGIKAGIICWFTERDVTIYVPIQRLQYLQSIGRKSIKFDSYLYDESVMLIKGKKKRVFFDYDMRDFFERMEKNK